MTTLYGYGSEVDSIFDLLGTHENDITMAIAFTLSRSPAFLESFLQRVLPLGCNFHNELVTISFQTKEKDGITDIEIEEPGVFSIVIEAKRGFNLPGNAQLLKYANDLNQKTKGTKLILTLSDSLYQAAKSIVPTSLDGIPIKHLQYSDVYEIANLSSLSSNKVEQALLGELKQFLKGVINMRDLHSNTVYVVPLSGSTIGEHDVDRTYHCPVGHRFIKYVPNYIGFRYGGKLQYINHVDDVEYYDENGTPFFRFKLGPDIIPSKEVRTGAKYQGTKVYCDIDLLLTCDSIFEAKKKTDERHK